MHLSQQKQPYDGIFVISLQGTPNADPHNEGRLDDFKKAWRKSCGADPEINVCPGVMDDRRGKGKVWPDLPEDTFIAFLGGHTWTYATEDQKKPVLLASTQPSRYLETSFSYGTYGFAVPRRSLDTLLNTIKDDLAHGFIDEDGVRQTEFLSPEKSWYRTDREVGKKMYAIHPLAVWHEGGFSNTWKMDRESITGEEEDDDDGKGDNEGGIRGVAAR
eukprot:scaffold1442_cov132-Skeletonema_dohrnii-CCMP3373.AAC.2